MNAQTSEFVQIERTFHELGLGSDDEAEMHQLLGAGNALRWSDLLAEHRVVLLSEAGSGKTAEIRNIARRLREEEKSAFFVRIEHVTQEFEGAFEEGTYEEFIAWSNSGQEGWLFLDSVDEARLREPGDFERAIRKLGRHLKAVLQPAHIVITSRITAWRAKTDLYLCRTQFPYQLVVSEMDEDASSRQGTTVKNVDVRASATAPFKVVALNDIQGEQFNTFIKAKGVDDVSAFRDAVERNDAWLSTKRPLDLSELVEFWRAHGRVGSRLELIENSIERRLEERDQNRADARPIAKEKLLLGAQLIAAAATLGQESAICVPDGSENAKGISARDVLTNWNETDCATLLGRPIFDEGIYGTVRFYHRSVREYLTARWLHSLLKDHASRTEIEGLFFKSQYGVEVIAPTMRPILPWLVLLDGRILERVCRIAPEILFEGGDPSQLPREKSSQILRQVCEQLTQPAHRRSMMDYAAVQRFATAELADDVKALLAQFGGDDEIAWFLARMVWHGEMRRVAPEMKELALRSESGNQVRQAALHALSVVGAEKDREEIRSKLIDQDGKIPREFISELVPQLSADEGGVDWLLTALERAAKVDRYRTDTLSDVVSQAASNWPLELLPQWISGLKRLLSMPPVVERRYCEMSDEYKWLARHAAEAIVRLVDARDPAALAEPTLWLLYSIPILHDLHDSDIGGIRQAIRKVVVKWFELNHKLFWYAVARVRADRDAKNSEPLTSYRQAGSWGQIWNFDTSDFEEICIDVATRTSEADRLVALTLAFAIYVSSGRPALWRRKLVQAVAAETSLMSALKTLFRPLKSADAQWRKQDAVWRKQRKMVEARNEENKRKWKEYIRANFCQLLVPDNPKVLTDAQMHLYETLRSEDSKDGRSGKLGKGRWRFLIPEFGEEVANAFRDGAMRYWRHGRPALHSGGSEENSIYSTTIFGLEGLQIESQEIFDWPQNLSDAEAKTAAGFAMLELNGFPPWLSTLYARHPNDVIDTVIREIDFELANDDPKKDRNYVLADVAWDGRWLWDGIASLLLKRLEKSPRNVRTLRDLLTIVQGSSLPDFELARLAAKKARTTRGLPFASQWFATWVGVDPDVAVPALAARIAQFKRQKDKTEFAMLFIVALMGDRRDSSTVRQAYRKVPHMKALLLLTHEHVRSEEDIDRVGKGVYSPELRDNAQDARNALLAFIREARGKEAFLALSEIAQSHPNEASRLWIAHHAKEKAIQDADIAPWSPGRVREFHDNVERTPGTHRELWELAVNRLTDLKRDVEDGDASIASMLLKVDEETEIRKFIGGWCRDRAAGRYLVTQEEELADAKRPDLRFNVNGLDAPVPVELKIADKWTGPRLHERLEEQLCGDYLRDARSNRGIFALVFRGERAGWDLPSGGRANTFEALVQSLQDHWASISGRYSGVDDVRVVGIDLTKRGSRVNRAPGKRSVASRPAI
ncbi:MAG: hypothetical protein ABIW82_04305 [Dokdonella sp.]